MHSVQPVANPFALLLNPEAVVAEMERSERLNRLSSRICRPLDRPHPASSGDHQSDDADLVVRDADAEAGGRIG